VKPLDAQAATKKVATASNGKYMYYSTLGTIYRIDTNTGKTKKIVKIPKTSYITDVTYYKGYLYCTVDYYYDVKGTDASKPYVCRVKANGKGFKKLDAGNHPVIYNGKLYYTKMKFSKSSYGDVISTDLGIYRMNLSGKKSSRKKIVSGNKYYGDFTIANNRLYYITGNTNCSQLCSADLSGSDRKDLASGVRTILTDGKDIYYATSTALRKITTSTGNDTSLLNLAHKTTSWGITPYTDVLAVRDGKIYFLDRPDNTYKLRYYDTKTKNFNTIKVFKMWVNNLQVGKGNYMIMTMGITYDSKYHYTQADVKITKKGKYKILKKYYRA
jgi:hypothetical protein